MSPPFAPVREAIRRLANGLTPVELGRARDVELHCELCELFVGHWPGLMRSLGQALSETVPLFVGREFEVADHDRGPDVGSCLPEG
jgi:hypothetical protein